MTLAVFLRDGTHTAATNRLALPVDSASIQIAKTPIQIPIPQQSPELFDIGIFRPSITISGLIKTVGLPTGSFPYMESQTIGGQIYYIPYKNILETAASTWLADGSKTIEVELGELTNHVSTPGISDIMDLTQDQSTGEDTQIGSGHTGGGIYRVAIQQIRFEFTGAQEHFWTYTLQFISEVRSDILFPV